MNRSGDGILLVVKQAPLQWAMPSECLEGVMWVCGDPAVVPWHPLLERMIGGWAECSGGHCVHRFVQADGGRVEYGLLMDPGMPGNFWWRVGGMRWVGDVLRFGLEIGIDGRDEPIGGGRRPHALWVSGIGGVVAVEYAMPGWITPKLGFWWRVE